LFNPQARQKREPLPGIETLTLPARPLLLKSFEQLPPRVGILGGTFDPVHDGHIGAALAALVAHNLDIVILLPTGRHPLKHHAPLSSTEARIEKIITSLSKVPQLYVSDFELEKKPPYLTIDTLVHIKQRNPSTQLFFILGMDNAQKMGSWVRMDEYRAAVQFIPVGRNGLTFRGCESIDQSLSEELQSNFVNLDINISSTEIRRASLRT
jgi:nicotinate-nucleotide adenylyltransferase